MLNLLKCVKFSCQRKTFKHLNFETPIIKLDLFAKCVSLLGNIIESGFLDEANDLNLFKNLVNFDHVKRLDSIVSRLKEIRPMLVEFKDENESFVSDTVVSFVELLSLFKKLFMGKQDKITAKQLYMLQVELINTYEGEILNSQSLKTKIFESKIIDLQDVEMVIKTSLVPGNSDLDDNREMYSKGEIFFNNFFEVLQQKYSYAKPFFVQVKDRDGFYITIDSDKSFKRFLEDNFDKKKMKIFAKFYIKPQNPDFYKKKSIFDSFGNNNIFPSSQNKSLFNNMGGIFAQNKLKPEREKEEKCFYCNRTFIVIKSYDESKPLVCQDCDQRLSNTTKGGFFQ